MSGLGRQNHKQGLGEYAVERSAVDEFAASVAVSGTVGGPNLQLKVNSYVQCLFNQL